jgi:thioredoxin-like negative regulator of GroEL
MPLFSRRVAYDRKRLLARADSLARGWRWRQALRIYRQLLCAEPRNPEIHFKLAPLLARAGRRVEAWESFRVAAEACERPSQEAELLAIQQQAVKSLPREREAHRALARCELKRQRPERALKALVAGSRRLRRRRTRGDAIVLLGDAREIEPWNPDVVIELCRLLARSGDAAAALFLLDQLDGRTHGRDRSAVRALTFRIEPSLIHGWRWLRARSEARGELPRVAPARPRPVAR